MLLACADRGLGLVLGPVSAESLGAGGPFEEMHCGSLRTLGGKDTPFTGGLVVLCSSLERERAVATM